MEKRKFTAPDLEGAVEAMVGPYKLAYVYRHISGDKGPTIHIFGPVEGEDREIMRFDCFQNEPHIHFGISYLDEPVQMIDSPDPFDWVVNEIGQHFPDYLTRSQAGCELPDDWQPMTMQTMEKFRTAMRASLS